MDSIDNICVNFQDILDSYERIKDVIHRTPIFTSNTLNELSGGKSLFLKCEQFQKVGAFKFRGASNAVLSLSDDEALKGVVTHSSGNHAQALALAAKMRGIPSYIVMPKGSPSVKLNAVKDSYNGNVILCENNILAREQECDRVQKETGATFIHPYDNKFVISGQGTSAYELLNEINDLDAIIAPVGGGGLLSGTSIASKGINPNIRVFGAEPLMANDAQLSLESGKIIPQTNPRTIADGLRTSLGKLTFPIIKQNVEKIITVTEEEIINAMKIVWERMKLIIEPSSAVAVAVALSDEFKSYKDIKKVGIIISGGNVDIEKWKWDQLSN